MRNRHILCPTDFSETAFHAMDYAIEMANFYNVDIRIVHVVDQPIGNDTYQILAITTTELAESMEQAAAEKMAGLLDQLNVNLNIETVIRRGEAITQILEDAEQNNAGMIVMASHGRTGLAHFLHTNVAESVANKAKCPVLVVK